jgi:ABC-type amino acid transport substrate-binding protein
LTEGCITLPSVKIRLFAGRESNSEHRVVTQGRFKMKWFFQGLFGVLLASLASTPATAGEVLDRVQHSSALRVCVWPDYYGISYRNPKTRQFTGIDIDMSAEFARELGVRLHHVDSSFATLVEDLLKDRCDIAMFAVGVLPQREKVLRFSQPYLQSDIYAVTTRSSRVVRRWEDIDQPGVQVAVQAGTFMEPVMRDALKQASMVVIRPPATREQELEAGRVDVFMTDYPYSRRLLDNAEWARLISPPQPFHVLPYAYALRPGDDEWLARVNRFVADMRQDGRLESAARRHRLSETVIRPTAR